MRVTSRAEEIEAGLGREAQLALLQEQVRLQAFASETENEYARGFGGCKSSDWSRRI